MDCGQEHGHVECGQGLVRKKRPGSVAEHAAEQVRTGLRTDRPSNVHVRLWHVPAQAGENATDRLHWPKAVPPLVSLKHVASAWSLFFFQECGHVERSPVQTTPHP